jgi:REP element-mobilizing transposase RayT
MGSTLTNLVYHIIFSTKVRESLITHEIRDELYSYIGGIVKGEGGILFQIGGTSDHIHLLIKLNPVHTLSGVMKKIKGNSSKWINAKKRLMGKFSWQKGYGAFSVSESQIQVVARYIKDQENHHKKLTFQDEFRVILERHQIEYDERYLWN